MRQHALVDAKLSGDGSTTAAAFRATMHGNTGLCAHNYMTREMAALRATLHLSCGKVQQLSVAVDGARFGRPARAYNLGFLSDPLGGVHSALPPMVPRLMLLSDCVFLSG